MLGFVADADYGLYVLVLFVFTGRGGGGEWYS